MNKRFSTHKFLKNKNEKNSQIPGERENIYKYFDESEFSHNLRVTETKIYRETKNCQLKLAQKVTFLIDC